MRVAYYSPLPPETSGIADYSALLLPALQQRVEVETARRGRHARGDGSPVLGAFGHMNASKRVPQLLAAFGGFQAANPTARLLLVGAAAPGLDLELRIEHEG